MKEKYLTSMQALFLYWSYLYRQLLKFFFTLLIDKHPSIHPYVCPSVHPSIHPSIHPSTYPSTKCLDHPFQSNVLINQWNQSIDQKYQLNKPTIQIKCKSIKSTNQLSDQPTNWPINQSINHSVHSVQLPVDHPPKQETLCV